MMPGLEEGGAELSSVREQVVVQPVLFKEANCATTITCLCD